MMKNTTLKRVFSLVMALSLVMSLVAMPAAATGETPTGDTPAGDTHTCSFTVEEILTAATCGQAGEKKLSCSTEGCEEFTTQPIPATGEHDYVDGVCTVCSTPKPCTLAADCDANAHVEECLSQCDSTVGCENKAHKEGCLSQADCTCVRLCSETKACPVCQGEGECKGGEAAERIAAVQVLIDALPSQYNLSQAETIQAQYNTCTDAISALASHERAALDLTKYEATSNPTVIDDVNVAFIGNTGYPSLEAAVTAAQPKAVISLKAGTYTLPVLKKHLTFKANDGVAAKDVIIDLGTTTHSGSDFNVEVAFTGLTLVRPSSQTYKGFHHATSETYTDCIIKGQYFTYGTNVTFDGCTFETTDAENYNIWTYTAGNITFTDCVFNCAGKSVLIYNEGNNGVNAEFTGCTFTASAPVTGKAAIEIDSSLLKNKMHSITVDSETKANGFANGSISGNSLWNNKKGSLAEVTVGNTKVLSLKPTAETLPLLFNRGGTIKLEDNITLTDSLTVPAGKTVTLDLNGKTLSQTKAQTTTYAMITNKGTLTIQDSLSGGKISYTDSGNGGEYASNTIRNEGTLYVKSGTVENLSSDTVAQNGYPHAIDCYAGSSLYVEGGNVKSEKYSAIRMFCVTSGNIAATISGGTIIGNIDFHNVDGNANKGSLTITGGNMTTVRLVNFGTALENMKATISGGTIAGDSRGCVLLAGSVKDNIDLKNVFTITGGTFGKDVSSLLTLQYTQDEDGKVVKATPTASVPKVEVSETLTETNDAQDDVIDIVTENTAVNTANSATATTLNSKIDEEDLEDAVEKLMADADVKAETGSVDLKVTLKVDILDVPKDEADVSKVTGIVFDVAPVIQAVNENGDVLAEEPISELSGLVSVTLPVPFDVEYVNLKHTHGTGSDSVTTNMGDFRTSGTGTARTVTLTMDQFSEVEVTPKTGTPVASVTVGSSTKEFTDIEDALKELTDNGGTLKLLANVETDETVTIPNGKTVTIDLNGKTYTYKGASDAIVNNGTLTLTDTAATKGKFIFDNPQTTGLSTFLWNQKGTVNITNCAIEADVLAIGNGDSGNSGTDRIVNISGATITTTGKTTDAFYSILNHGAMRISDSNISADYGVIRNSANTMTIENSTVTGGKQPGQHSYTVFSAGGKVTIDSGTFSGNAESLCGAYNGVIEVNGGTFSGGVYAFKDTSSTAGVNNVVLNGGTFNREGTNAFNNKAGSFLGPTAASGKIYIPGTSTALFKTNPADTSFQDDVTIATNYSAKLNSSGMYQVEEKPHAVVNGVKQYYDTATTLDDILDDAEPGTTIQLAQDDVINDDHDLTNVTIDLNGKKLSGDGSITAKQGTGTTASTVTLNNIGTTRSKLILGMNDTVSFNSDGKLTVEPAENTGVGTTPVSYGYGNVEMSMLSSSGTLNYMFFVGKGGVLTINTDGNPISDKYVKYDLKDTTNPNMPAYHITDITNSKHGDTNNFVYGSSETMTVESDGFYEGFADLIVDGSVVDSKYYTVTNDDSRVKLTISNSFLRTLTKGKHSVAIAFKDGGKTTTDDNIYVVSTISVATTPKTGDPIMTAVFTMAMAVSGLAALAYIGKKKMF